MLTLPVMGTPIDRRRFLTQTGTWLLGSAALLPAAPTSPPLARLGIATDIHYADKPAAGTRQYRASLDKLAEAVKHWTGLRVDAAIQLGDVVDASPTVDAELADLRRVRQALRRLETPQYFCLGNHCVYTLNKPQFLEAWGADATWYSFQLPGYQCLVLDSAFTSDGVAYGGREFDWRDSYLPPTQVEWLGQQLKAASLPVVIFLHHRLDVAGHYGVRNAPQIREVLEQSGKVTAVFQGHNHVNDHKVIGGIHYCTLKAVVDGPPPESSAYGVLEFYPNGVLHLKGYRLLSSLELPKLNP